MTYIYYRDAAGEWRWRLKASNGRIIADSGEGYSTERECIADIERVKASRDAPMKKEQRKLSVCVRRSSLAFQESQGDVSEARA